MVTHKVKIKKEFTIQYFEGTKPWELRENDRNYKTGDVIEFTVIETGMIYSREIKAMYSAGGPYGLKKGWCILTMEGYDYDPNFHLKHSDNIIEQMEYYQIQIGESHKKLKRLIEIQSNINN